MQYKVVWRGQPSIFHFMGSYLTAIIGVYVIYRLQVHLFPHPVWLMENVNWHRPLNSWSWHDWPIGVIALGFVVMFFLVLNAVFKLLKARFTEFLLMEEQVVVRHFTAVGIVENRTELYRIIDYSQTQTFLNVFFGLSSVVLRSTDQVSPLIRLFGIKNGDEVINILRTETERCRLKKGVREITSPGLMGNPQQSGKGWR